MRVLVIGLAALCCCFFGARAYAQDVASVTRQDVANSFKILRLEGNSVRWQKQPSGAGLVLSYRIVSSTQEFPGARNCRKMTKLDDLMAASYVAIATLRQEVAAAFAMWEAAANLRFREVSEGSPADILIGAQVEPEGWAFADVFYDAASPERIKPISQALICLNPDKHWKVGFDGDLKTYDLRYTLAHEIGHAIGLDHPNIPGQIMGYRYEERFRALQPGDVKGAVALYGERLQPGVTIASEQEGNAARRTSVVRRIAKRLGTRALNARSY